MNPADVIVVGLGAMGAATLYQLARRGCRAVGLDRFVHHGQDAFVQRTIGLAAEHGIDHEVLSPDALMARFPQFRLRGDEIGYYEPEAGMLFPEACVQVQIDLARRHGAVVRLGQTVLGIEQDGAGVTVRTAVETLHAAQCVVAAGAWMGKLLGGALPSLARPFRQTLHWFAPGPTPEFRAPDFRAPDFSAPAFPVFIWIHGSGAEDYFYGFPASPDDGGVKFASETYHVEADPDGMTREVSPQESAAIYREHVGPRLPGLSSRVLRAKACLYTVTPDAGFIVDTLPGADRILVVSACSGHGFKHSAALGEAIAGRVVDGGSAIPLDSFSLRRLAASLTA